MYNNIQEIISNLKAFALHSFKILLLNAHDSIQTVNNKIMTYALSFLYAVNALLGLKMEDENTH